MSESNLDIVKGIYGAFAKGDMAAVLGTFSADIEWTETEGSPYGGVYAGPDAVLAGVFMRLGTEWEGFAAVPHEFIDGGSSVVVLCTYSGKYSATGKSFTAQAAHVWKVRDGKAYRFQQYVDSAKMNAAM